LLRCSRWTATTEKTATNKAFAKMAVSLRVKSFVLLNIFVLWDSDVRFNPPLRKPPERYNQWLKRPHYETITK
jgi:hypothetical protein